MIFSRGAVAHEEAAAEPAAERVGGQVAGTAHAHTIADQHVDRDLPLAGDDAADQDGGLARRDEPDERAGLEEGERADEQVGPLAEPGADVLDQLRRGSAARRRRGPTGRAPATTSTPTARVTRPSVPRRTTQEDREPDGADEREGVHQRGCAARGRRHCRPPTGSAASAARPRAAAAAARARRAVRAEEEADDGRARSRRRARGRRRRARAASSAASIAGTASGRRPGGRCGLRAGRGAHARVELGQLGVRAGEAEAVGLAVDVGRRERGVDGEDEHAERRGLGQAVDVLAGAGHQHAAGADCGWGRRRRAAAPSSSRAPGTPAACAASRSVGRGVGGAAAHAGGDRDALVDRQPLRRRVPAGRLAERARARAPARLGPSTPGQTTSSACAGAGSSVSSSASESGWTTETSGCSPSSRGRADVEAEVDLAGARAQRRALIRAASCVQRAPLLRGRASRRARRRAGRCASSAARARVAVASPAQRERARRAPCAGARSRLLDERAQRRRRRGAATRCRPTSTESTFGHRVEHVPRDRAQHAHLARELGEHRRHPVGGRAGLRREPLADLASAPSRPRSSTLGQLLDRRAGSPSPPRRRAGWRRPSSAPGRARARSSLTRVAEVQRGVRRAGRARRAAAARAGGRARRRARGATRVGEVLGQHAEPAADLEHDVVRRRAPPRARSRRAGSSRSGSSGPARGSGGCRTPSCGAGSAAPGARSPAEQPRGVAPRPPPRAPRRRSRAARR